MSAKILIDYGDHRTPALLHEVRAWLKLCSRAGWKMREQDLADTEEQPGRLALLIIDFDDPNDTNAFVSWRDFDRWTESA